MLYVHAAKPGRLRMKVSDLPWEHLRAALMLEMNQSKCLFANGHCGHTEEIVVPHEVTAYCCLCLVTARSRAYTEGMR